MRILIVLPLLALAACQVSKDNANNTVSVTLNGDMAANTAADVRNVTENIASDITNDVKKTGDKIQNTDVSVNTNADVHTSTSNKQ